MKLLRMLLPMIVLGLLISTVLSRTRNDLVTGSFHLTPGASLPCQSVADSFALNPGSVSGPITCQAIKGDYYEFQLTYSGSEAANPNAGNYVGFSLSGPSGLNKQSTPNGFARETITITAPHSGVWQLDFFNTAPLPNPPLVPDFSFDASVGISVWQPGGCTNCATRQPPGSFGAERAEPMTSETPPPPEDSEDDGGAGKSLSGAGSTGLDRAADRDALTPIAACDRIDTRSKLQLLEPQTPREFRCSASAGVTYRVNLSINSTNGGPVLGDIGNYVGAALYRLDSGGQAVLVDISRPDGPMRESIVRTASGNETWYIKVTNFFIWPGLYDANVEVWVDDLNRPRIQMFFN